MRMLISNEALKVLHFLACASYFLGQCSSLNAAADGMSWKVASLLFVLYLLFSGTKIACLWTKRSPIDLQKVVGVIRQEDGFTKTRFSFERFSLEYLRGYTYKGAILHSERTIARYKYVCTLVRYEKFPRLES